MFSIAIILGGWFNKSKVIFISLILAVFYWSYPEIPSPITTLYSPSHKLRDILSVVVPLNLLLFSFLKERGIFSIWGKLKFALLILQGWGVIYVVQSTDIEIYSYLDTEVSLPLWRGIEGVPDVTLIVFMLTIFILFIKSMTTKVFIDRVMVATLVAIFMVPFLERTTLAFPIFYSAIGLMLVISVIQSSYKMAYIDELTQIPSRRALEENLLKLGGQYTIAMLDIDFFKKFNDKYGHDIGDDVLAMVASVIKDVSAGGKAFRYGGEEFTILFPGKGIDDVMPHLEKLREKVSKKGFPYRKKTAKKSKKTKTNQSRKLHVTISIGVSEKNHNYATPVEVRNAADKALYRAKKKGRNCVSK
ncbi:MAG: GGDEF domain-containing protein [Clostridiaceae bacterium]|nr:GGDEF domain-containing protein [Clostridiaceae bacterium]